MAQDWDIKPRGEACAGCHAAFQDRQRYHSALVFGAEGYARSDYCDGCWPAIESDGKAYSAWEGLFRLPPPKPEEPLKKETAESLLRRLMEEDDPSQLGVVYILAVMLERKRVLAEKDVQAHEDGTLVRIYEHRKTGETFLVADPRLQLDQLEDVQRRVVDLLGGDRKPAAEPESQPAAPPADAGAAPDAAAGLKGGFYSKETAQ